MALVDKLRFLNKHGGLETAKTGDHVEALVVAAVGALGEGVVLIVSFLAILFMFTGENGLV